MARIDLLVDGRKRRFVLSTAASDSVIPEHWVPSERMVRKAVPFLAAFGGSVIDTTGFYQAVLESPDPDVDFRMSFPLTVAEGSFGVLGNDFLDQARMEEMVFGQSPYISVVNEKGFLVRLPLTIQRGPEKDGTIIVPALSRLPIKVPSPKPSSSASNDNQCKQRTRVTARNVVFFHLETTGFGNDAEIIEIAATCRSVSFSVQILPDGDIHPKAAERNGFSISRGRLYRRNKLEVVTPRREAVLEFLDFLREMGGSVVLAAHNASPFHAPILKRLIASLGLTEQFESQVRGLADTLPLFRKALQGRAVQSFNLDLLAKNLLKKPYTFHCGEGTVAALELLLKEVRISYKEIIESAEPFAEVQA